MGGIDKLLHPLAGRPLVAHAVAAFVAHAEVGQVVVAVSAEARAEVERCLPLSPKLSLVLGGARRRDSVHAGLVTLADCEYVLVHDGARPLVTGDLIDAALAGAREFGAALCAVPVTDTVKRSNESAMVRGTIAREGLWLAQTPQAFRLDLLMRAHATVEGDITDDAAMVEHLGEPVRLVAGSPRNIKVTTPEDLALVEALLRVGS